MNKDLETLDNFVTTMAAKGYITMKEYIDLKVTIERLAK